VEEMSEMYLVTGAAGHLGSAVVRQLVEKGCPVRALVLRGDKAADRLPKEVERFQGDLLDKESLKRFFDVGKDREVIVIHCAGIVSTTSKFFQLLHDVNVTGTKNIVDLCLAAKVKKLVHVSSVHAIPVLPHGHTMKEVESFDPEKVVGPYAKTKAEATRYVLDAVKAGLDASIVFPAGICGPFDCGKGHVTQLIIDFYQGRMPVGIRGGFDFVDVRDVAAGILSCCRKGGRGECYILANRYVTVAELLDLLHETTGKRKTGIYAPRWLVKASIPFCHVYYKLRKQPPLYNTYSIHTLTVNSKYSHKKAEAGLRYTTRPFSETIRDTVRWLKAEGRI
jgi:dihydroflavonol-4-reductase